MNGTGCDNEYLKDVVNDTAATKHGEHQSILLINLVLACQMLGIHGIFFCVARDPSIPVFATVRSSLWDFIRRRPLEDFR